MSRIQLDRSLVWLSSLPSELQSDISFSRLGLNSPLRDLRLAIASISPGDFPSLLDAGTKTNYFLDSLLAVLDSSPVARKWTPLLTLGRPALNRPILELRTWLTDTATISSTHPNRSICLEILRAVNSNCGVPDLWRLIFDCFKPELPNPQFTGDDSTQLKQTPIKNNSGNRISQATIHSVVDPRIKEELHNCVYPDTLKFFETFFSPKTESFNRSNALRKGSSWKTWPVNAEQSDVMVWLLETSTTLLESIGSIKRNYYTSADQPLAGSNAIRKTDIVLYPTSSTGKNPKGNKRGPWKLNWSDVLVVGELKQAANQAGRLNIIVQLAGYVRLIFHLQQRRRYVHAFTLTGEHLRCWIFHRGGAFGSTVANINQDPQKFVDVIVGYAMMDMEQLGYDTTIDFDRPFSMEGSDSRYYFEKKAFFTRACIASRGTTCWELTKDGDTAPRYVLKDAWRSIYHNSEITLLTKALAANVKGLVEVIAHEELQFHGRLDDIRGSIMRGLSISAKPFKLLQVPQASTDERPSLPYPIPGSLGSTAHGFSGASKSSSLTTPAQESSAPSSSDGIATRTRSGGVRPVAQASSPKRKASYSPAGSPKRPRVTPTSPSDFNRIHTRILMRRGRNLWEFSSLSELLWAFHDAIQCHRDLLTKANILHRDISIFNIMLSCVDVPRADAKRGFLIDLDLAVEVSSPPSGAPHRTGTMEFMAIQVLRKHKHTYRHDLESFWYVLIWVCVYKNWYHGGRETPLRKWSGESMTAAANEKRLQIVKGTEEGGYGDVEKYFCEECTPLIPVADEWRKILFKVIGTEGERELGTPLIESVLYEPILGLLRETAEQL